MESSAERVLRDAGMLAGAGKQGDETMTVQQYDDDNPGQPAVAPVTDFGEIDAVLMGAPPAAQFKDIGALVQGKIARIVLRQATDFDSKEPKWWPDGRPVMEPVITLETADGLATLYAGSSGMREALREACRQAGIGLRPGGQLAVRYTEDEPAKKRGMNGRKLYEAGYDPPGTALPPPRPGPTYAQQIERD